jgi:hypothetical protein
VVGTLECGETVTAVAYAGEWLRVLPKQGAMQTLEQLWVERVSCDKQNAACLLLSLALIPERG